MVEGKYIDWWVVLYFSSYEGFNKLNLDQFILKFIKRYASLGIRMCKSLLYEFAGVNVLSIVVKLDKLLLGVAVRFYEIVKKLLHNLLCVMATRDPSYNYPK